MVLRVLRYANQTRKRTLGIFVYVCQDNDMLVHSTHCRLHFKGSEEDVAQIYLLSSQVNIGIEDDCSI